MIRSGYRILWISVFLMFFHKSQAQDFFWTKVMPEEIAYKTLMKDNSPTYSLETYELKTKFFAKELQNAPTQFSSSSGILVDLPVLNGELQRFRVFQASVFAPELQEKYPSIQSYIAQGVEDLTASARISVTDFGVHIIVHSGNHPTIYIDPYTEDKTTYAVYSTDSLQSPEEIFQCLVQENDVEAVDILGITTFNARDGMLRKFRLALACTNQYASFHLNRQNIASTASEYDKKEAVLSEMNVALNRINSIFERDVSITMELVENNDELIFLDQREDPYSNNDSRTMLTQNITTLNDIIGISNYDIGHVFSTGGGGVAYLGSVCTSYKAGGVTGLYSPISDPFYVDYVSHEMGHQFGANHTFNSSAGNCGGYNRNDPTAVEPGSGSTIMGYAGICSPENVQNGSDAYFHNISISEMWQKVSVRGSCAFLIDTGNQAPVVNTTPTYRIPKSTPFVLDGVASDPDGDALTYNWEQIDAEIVTQPPLDTNVKGPAFRSFGPTEDSKRYFPRLASVLDGTNNNRWEVLPAVERTMKFRLTVRDNVAGGGASESSPTTVSVDGNAGPFVITSQNGKTTWKVGMNEEVIWDVANTDNSDIQCMNVDILFSLDGGLTYPIVLAENIPNTGNATVVVPDEEVTTARIMVKASNNIFFDINNQDITITSSMGMDDYSFSDFMLYPNPSTGIYNIEFAPETIGQLEIILYDVNGRRIKQETYQEISSSIFRVQLDYQDIKTGLYFLKIRNNEKTATKPLIKR